MFRPSSDLSSSLGRKIIQGHQDCSGSNWGFHTGKRKSLVTCLPSPSPPGRGRHWGSVGMGGEPVLPWAGSGAGGETAAGSSWVHDAPWGRASLSATSQKVIAPAWRIFQFLMKPPRQCVGKVQPLIPN